MAVGRSLLRAVGAAFLVKRGSSGCSVDSRTKIIARMKHENTYVEYHRLFWRIFMFSDAKLVE